MPTAITRNNNPVTFRIDGKSVTVKSGDTLTSDMADKLAIFTSAVCFIEEKDNESLATISSTKILQIDIPSYIGLENITNLVLSDGDIVPVSLAVYAKMNFGINYRLGIKQV